MYLKAFSTFCMALACLVFLGACSRDGSNDVPPKSNESLAIESRPSSIVIPIVVPLSQLQAQLESKIPNPLFVVDQHLDACIPAKWITVCTVPKIHLECDSKKWWKCRNVADGCAVAETKTKISPDIGCTVKGDVTRGKIVLEGADKTISMTMPVHVEVSAKDVGGIIKSETATGFAVARAGASLDIDEDWQPVVSINADYSWEKRIGVDILGRRITFASEVDPKVREAIDKFKAEIPAQLASLKIKDKLSQAWASGFSSFQLSENPSAWLRFSPKAIGFSGYTISDGEIRFSLMAEGLTETFLGTKPSDPTPTPLPKLVKDLTLESFDFYLPILASYSALREEALKALQIGTEQTFEVPNIGQVKVTFKDVSIYQTTDRALAIGINMAVDPPESFFDTKGTIWLTATPEVDNETRLAGVKEFHISADTDNAAVNLLASILRLPAINSRLKDAMRYDFNADYKDVLTKSNSALRRELAPNLFLDGQIDNVAVDKVAATPEGFFLGLIVTGSATLHYSGTSS